MENQLPMPYPSDEPDETEREYINLDAMPDEALASLVEIELPRLIPLFGLLPDIAIFSGHQPGAPACAPPPGMDALLPEEKLHWHQTWDRILQVMGDQNGRCHGRVGRQARQARHQVFSAAEVQPSGRLVEQ